MYIAFEGIDTAGKSTQLQLLQGRLDAITTKEPGATKEGATIRELVLHGDLCKEAELFLFLADRAEHIEKVIKPNAEKTILSDRSLISNIAYAMTNGFSFELLRELNMIATQKVLPDHVFIFWLDEQTLHYRLSQKRNDAIEKRGIKYLLQVQENLLYAAKELRLRHSVVDATQSIEEIHQKVVKEVYDQRT